MSRVKASIARQQSNQPRKLEDLGSSPSWGISSILADDAPTIFIFNIYLPHSINIYIYIYIYNFPEFDLAACFGVGQTTVSRIFRVLYMSHSFRDVSIWPSQAYKCSKAPLATAFKEQYPTTRVIINATEFDFPVAKPSNPTGQSASWSSYNNRNTLKLLNGCTPNSALTFVSKVMVAVF